MKLAAIALVAPFVLACGSESDSDLGPAAVVAIGARARAAMSILQQKRGDDTGERNVIVGLRAVIP